MFLSIFIRKKFFDNFYKDKMVCTKVNLCVSKEKEKVKDGEEQCL